MSTTDGAHILDRGYRRFEGSRSGVPGAVRSVAWHTTRSILGLGRKARHKIFPILVIFWGAVPAIVFVGITAIIGNEIFDGELIPDYWEMFGNSLQASLVFAALVAPEAMVRDRRDGMLQLYLSTPLTRVTYLVAKAASVFGCMAVIMIGPTLLFLLGLTFAGAGPDGVGEWLLTFVRVIGAGAAMSLVFTTVSMAGSSMTTRRAFASFSVIVVLFGLLTVVAILVESAGWSQYWHVLNPVSIVFEIAPRVFGDRSEGLDDLPTAVVYGASAAWVAASVGLLWQRYRRLGV